MIRDCGHSTETSQPTGAGADCALCNDRQMPSSVTLGRRTPTFTAQTVPAALRKAHRTNAWAQLTVESGSVEFVEDGTGWRATATPAEPVTIVPRSDHHISPSADATFFVQFFDLPEAAEELGGSGRSGS